MGDPFCSDNYARSSSLTSFSSYTPNTQTPTSPSSVYSNMKRMSLCAVYGESYVRSHFCSYDDNDQCGSSMYCDLHPPTISLITHRHTNASVGNIIFRWGDNVHRPTDNGLRLFFVKTPKSSELVFEDLIKGILT
jgi:hypothetical protein